LIQPLRAGQARLRRHKLQRPQAQRRTDVSLVVALMRAAHLAAAGADDQRAHRVQIALGIGGVTLEELLMGAVLHARGRSGLKHCSGLGVCSRCIRWTARASGTGRARCSVLVTLLLCMSMVVHRESLAAVALTECSVRLALVRLTSVLDGTG